MIRFFAQHPTAANLLMIIFVVLGVISLPSLRRETFPDITPQEVELRVLYPGAAAEEIEESICERLEDAVDGVSFVKELRSDAREGLATTVVEMQYGGNFNFRSKHFSDPQRRADAAILMAETSLQAAARDIATVDRYQVIASVDVSDCSKSYPLYTCRVRVSRNVH